MSVVYLGVSITIAFLCFCDSVCALAFQYEDLDVSMRSFPW